MISPQKTVSHSPLKIQKPAFSLQSLSQEELINTIRTQGKIIGMGKWEINALIETFQKKNTLRKAYHILLEYSQLHNDIHKLILKRQSYMHKMFHFLKTHKEGREVSSPASGADVGHIASKLAEYSVKAWIAICRWRQLQWSPRPILFPSPPPDAHEDLERGEPVNVIKLFEEDAKDIFKLSSQHGIHLIDAGVKPVHLITILVSSAANVLSDTAIANAILRPPEVDNCEWAMENPADSHTQREVGILLSPYGEFISSLRDVAQTELSFDNVWQTFSNFRGTNQKNQSQNLPVLKLHYNNLATDAGAQDMSGKYCDACEVLLNFLVRNFSVVPASKKRGAGGDLHTSVLKSLANVNRDALTSTSPPTFSAAQGPSSANVNSNNHVPPAHSQFTASSPMPLHKTRPQSSPLVRSESPQKHEQGARTSTAPVPSNNQMQSPPKESHSNMSDLASRTREGNDERPDTVLPGLCEKEETKNTPDVGSSSRPLDKELNSSEGPTATPVLLGEDRTGLTTVIDDPVEKHAPQVEVDDAKDTKETSSVSVPVSTEVVVPTSGKTSSTNSAPVSAKSNEDPPDTVDVELEASAAGGLHLTLERVETQEQQPRNGRSRLVVADFQAFCPAGTMRAVNIGDEIISAAGVSVEGKNSGDIIDACKIASKSKVAARLKGTTNDPSSSLPPHVAVTVTLRKQYVGREAVVVQLKSASAAEQQIMDVSADDVASMEAALQQLKAEAVHLEECMEECMAVAGQEGFHNVRLQMMKNFSLTKTVQYKLSNALAAAVAAQKLEVVRLEDLKLESLRQEDERKEEQRQALQEEQKKQALQEEQKKQALQEEQRQALQEEQRQASQEESLVAASSYRDRTSTMDILEEENLDSLSWSQKKRKKKKNKRFPYHDNSDIYQSAQYRHFHKRPLIASLYFKKHWCSDAFGHSGRDGGFAGGVIDLREKDTNSNSAMYNYAKVRVVSNTIKHALRRVEVKGKGESKEVLAARKLCSWWGLIYPQKVLTMRMQIKTMMLDIIEAMVVRSFEIGAASTKRRMAMMRMAAATLIQQTFRKWKSTVLMHVIKIQKRCKRFLTRVKVLKLVNVVRAAVLVARFLYRRKIRLKMFVGKRVYYKRIIRNYMDHIGYLKRDSNQKEMMEFVSLGRTCKFVTNFADSKQGYMMQRRVDACIKIQSFFRMVLAQWYHKYLQQEDYICKKVRCAMKILQLRRKILNKRKLRTAAVKLQRTWRGCASRWKLFLQVIAGIKITAAWRKYRQYWKLKQCLRRIEFPVEIVLHGIRNIASQLIYSKKIKVRVSVWWNSLLHLVDNKDFMTITQSKQPHIIRTTGFYECEQMPEVKAPPAVVAAKTSALPPPVTAIKPRGGKRLSLMAQAQKINVGDGKKEENSLAAFVNRQSQNASRQTQEEKSSVSLKGIVKKSILTNLAITPIGGDSDEESESSSDSSSSSSCSDQSGQSQDDFFDDNVGGKAGSFVSGGRNSDIGSNLLGDSPSQLTLPPLTLPPGFTPGEQGAHPVPATRRTTMMRVSSGDVNADGSQKSKKTLSGTVNLINKGLLGFSSAFKHSQLKKKEEDKILPSKSSNVYQCDLNEETLYIPGCHGNAVIRFDLFDGDRKFGSNLFQLSEDKKLLFWGGEFNRDVSVTKIRRAVQLGNNTIKQTERNRLVQHEENPILDVRVVSGAALRSKCGWALVSIRGMGPIKRQRRAKGGFTKIFDDWDRGYLSMDGVNIYCFASKNAPNPWIVISLSDIKSIHIELNALSKGGDNKKKSAPTEDKFDVVVTSSSRDIFHFKFPGSSARENWVRTIVDAVDYSRESLRTRLNLKNVSGKNEKHMGTL